MFKGPTNIKCLSKASGRHVPPGQLQWFCKSLDITGGIGTFLPEDIPSFVFLMIMVESPKSPIGVQLGWDVVKANYSHHFHAHQTIQWPLMSCGQLLSSLGFSTNLFRLFLYSCLYTVSVSSLLVPQMPFKTNFPTHQNSSQYRSESGCKMFELEPDQCIVLAHQLADK